jgi:serine/threonine protein kinase
MKVLSKPNIVKRKQVEHTKTERRVLGSINHPFIVRLYYAFQTDDKLYFVLDYAGGGELFYHLSRMKKFSESTTRFYAAEITLALDALHEHVRCTLTIIVKCICFRLFKLVSWFLYFITSPHQLINHVCVFMTVGHHLSVLLTCGGWAIRVCRMSCIAT